MGAPVRLTFRSCSIAVALLLSPINGAAQTVVISMDMLSAIGRRVAPATDTVARESFRRWELLQQYLRTRLRSLGYEVLDAEAFARKG